MPWKDNSNSGGPWGGASGSGNGGKPRGPWGGGPNPGGRGSGPFGGGPPKFEDMLRRGGDRMKGILPGGLGSPRGIGIIGLVAVVGWLMTGWYQVGPNEAGVETVFGRMTSLTGQGLHWNWPSPIGAVQKPNVTAIRQTPVGFVSAGGRAGQSRSLERESLMLTGDENIIDIQATVLWQVDFAPRAVTQGGQVREASVGIRNFVFNIRRPEQTVKDAAEAALREIVGRRDFEVIRTSARAEIEEEAKRHIQEILDLYNTGVRVTGVQLQKIDPPTKVLDAFRDVQAARADRERLINEAQAYRNKEVQQAEGNAERITRAGEAYKAERIAIAEGESRRFLSVFEQYKSAKDITRQRIYLETMRDVLMKMDKVLIDAGKNGSGVVPYLPLDSLRTAPARPAPGETRPGGQQ
ncbi:MAG: FtsH protease activity modulator HflK [Candidatus Odyssella sp.]|nr:FtsH protease activity modulator HflK [Candidatus Odyssella sp.]